MRLIDSDGAQVGIVTLEDAVQKARDQYLDLVEIGPNADPPVCKIVDFKKFLYEKEKQEKEAKKKTKEVEVKEVRFGPFVSEHDLNFRLEKVRDFIKKGNKVKITVGFTGRQMRHTEFGRELMDKVVENLQNETQVEQEMKLNGRRLSLIIGPKK